MTEFILGALFMGVLVIIVKYDLWKKQTWKSFFVDKNKNIIPDVIERPKVVVKKDDGSTLKEEIRVKVKKVKKTGDQVDEDGNPSVTRLKK